MEQILLDFKEQDGIVIMIFVEGTIFKPKCFFNLYNHKNYIPIGNCIRIIQNWYKQGANIIYCTSRKNKQAIDIAELLKKYGFVGVKLCYRSKNEKYADIVETIKPNILIEDDCKSIGGAWQMCITNANSEIKKRIVSIVVPEFKGIDNLPLSIKELKAI